MIILYMIFAQTLLLRDPRVLYLLPAYSLVEIIQLVQKWILFFANDPLLCRAQACFANRNRIIRREIQKSLEGGVVRRQQEAIAIRFIIQSLSSTLHYLKLHSYKIRHRAVEERKHLLSMLGR